MTSIDQARLIARETAIRAMSLSGVRHVLPDFLIIGIKKGGTSSLYRYLRQHPLIRGGAQKELRFFHSHWYRGLLWYRRSFPLESDLRAQAAENGLRPLIVEATPDYLFWPEVPRRVAQAIPGRRFIALLRNPIDRAWSDYRAHLRAGRETRAFDEVIATELAILEGEDWTPHSFGHEAGKAVRLLGLGLYADQLERWYRCVPRATVLIVESQEFFDDPARTVLRVTDFLGLPPHGHFTFTPRNVGGYNDTMSTATRVRLRTFFEPHNHRLYGMLGRDLAWR